MDIFLLIIGIILILTGLAGCIVPVLPGPPLSFLGLLALEFTRWADYSSSFLWTAAGLALAVTVLDYLVPIWGTKRFGGTRRGVWGATLGLIVGLFFGPIGIILGPFLGALLGELSEHSDSNKAFKAAFGSFIGILTGVILKLIVSGLLTWYFVKELFV
jgi:hypothetical protein